MNCSIISINILANTVLYVNNRHNVREEPTQISEIGHNSLPLNYFLRFTASHENVEQTATKHGV